MRRLITFLILLAPLLSRGQTDTAVHLTGIVLSTVGLKPLPSVSVTVTGTLKGTITGEDGIFHIDARPGDTLEFSSVGYQPTRIKTPTGGDNIVLYLEPKPIEMAGTVIQSRPTSAQFQRDFLTAPVNDELHDVAKDNVNPATLSVMIAGLPVEASDIARREIAKQADDVKYGHEVRGQVSLLSLLNPMAWAAFIKSMQKK